MKKLLMLFLFTGMFLCFERDFNSKEVSAQGYSPAIVVQCPYCNATNTVYSPGKYSCFNCKKYFEVVPATASVPPPVVVAPPPVYYTPPPVYYAPSYPSYLSYPDYGGYYGPGLNLSFGFGPGCGYGGWGRGWGYGGWGRGWGYGCR